METKTELMTKLRRERMELTTKIRKLETFRGTKEWDNISVSHKQLLDIQLQAMRTYLECLIGRCLEIQNEELNEEQDDDKDNTIEAIIIIKGEPDE